MKIKMIEAVALNNFYSKIDNKQLPLPLTYKLAKAIKTISTELTFFQDQMNKYISLFAEKDADGKSVLTEDGNGFKIRANVVEECQRRITELENMEFDLPGFEFTLEELSPLELTIGEMTTLIPFITE